MRSNILWSLLLKWKINHRIELLKITKLEVWKDLCLLIYVCWFFSYSHKTVTNFVVFVGYRGTLITLSVQSCWEMPDLPIHLLMKCSVRIDYTPQFIFVVIFSAYCLNFLNTLSVTFKTYWNLLLNSLYQKTMRYFKLYSHFNLIFPRRLPHASLHARI